VNFLRTMALLCVLLTPAHAAEHFEADPLQVSIAEFVEYVKKDIELPLEKGPFTLLFLTHTDDTITTYVQMVKGAVEYYTPEKAAAGWLPFACELLTGGVITDLTYMEYVYYDYLGRETDVVTLSEEDCT